eukprot:TRINITY_DN51766_c0_g1_i1.p1 TRINITY_DN51766_c0_g1~~TRINITY_DN51766_c0_g1_i1.p1  ORF type:complete len:388 (+),score=56.24 TRINITY_DN51766_c0_g1_i1:30-1166(+)
MEPLPQGYPSEAELDMWCSEMVAEASRVIFSVVAVRDDLQDIGSSTDLWRSPQHLRFAVAEGSAPATGCKEFYCAWQPACKAAASKRRRKEDGAGPSPTLIMTPGYRGSYPSPGFADRYCAEGYNVLFVNPLGIASPIGLDDGKRVALSPAVIARLERLQESVRPAKKEDLVKGISPQLMGTVDHRGPGYREWLMCALIAIRWAVVDVCALVDRRRLAFVGRSQGGGGALLLGSVCQGACFEAEMPCQVRAVVADQPFMTNYPLLLQKTDALFPSTAEFQYLMVDVLGAKSGETTLSEQLCQAWRKLGFVDSISHAHRLAIPVWLSAGEKDGTCPIQCVLSLFERLQSTRSFVEVKGAGHVESPGLESMTLAWLEAYL